MLLLTNLFVRAQEMPCNGNTFEFMYWMTNHDGIEKYWLQCQEGFQKQIIVICKEESPISFIWLTSKLDKRRRSKNLEIDYVAFRLKTDVQGEREIDLSLVHDNQKIILIKEMETILNKN